MDLKIENAKVKVAETTCTFVKNGQSVPFRPSMSPWVLSVGLLGHLGQHSMADGWERHQ